MRVNPFACIYVQLHTHTHTQTYSLSLSPPISRLPSVSESASLSLVYLYNVMGVFVLDGLQIFSHNRVYQSICPNACNKKATDLAGEEGKKKEVERKMDIDFKQKRMNIRFSIFFSLSQSPSFAAICSYLSFPFCRLSIFLYRRLPVLLPFISPIPKFITFLSPTLPKN